MAESKAGSILSLIGGILGILISIILLGFAALFAVFGYAFGGEAVIPGILLGVAGVWSLITAIMTIIAGVWMRKPETTKRGGMVALICSVVGAGTIFGLIGGILGLVEGDK